MAIYESGEDYLETILILKNKNGSVRSIDIASELGYSKPSVSRAVGVLKKAGYILVDEKGHITFTEDGLALAEKIYNRHETISQFFVEVLGISEDTAVKDACRIEHDLSDETFGKICDALDLKRKV